MCVRDGKLVHCKLQQALANGVTLNNVVRCQLGEHSFDIGDSSLIINSNQLQAQNSKGS